MIIGDDVRKALRRRARIMAAEKLAEGQVFGEEIAEYFVDTLVPRLSSKNSNRKQDNEYHH